MRARGPGFIVIFHDFRDVYSVYAIAANTRSNARILFIFFFFAKNGRVRSVNVRARGHCTINHRRVVRTE